MEYVLNISQKCLQGKEFQNLKPPELADKVGYLTWVDLMKVLMFALFYDPCHLTHSQAG